MITLINTSARQVSSLNSNSSRGRGLTKILLIDQPGLKYFKDDLDSLVSELRGCCKGDKNSPKSKEAVRQLAAKREKWILAEKQVCTMYSAFPFD